jgi:RimJ/RimL family protein N-acetyltransferase
MEITLKPMTREMYHRYLKEYENSPELFFDPSKCVPYVYDRETVDRYVQRQIDLGRIPLAILCGDEIVLKNIEDKKCATMGICLKGAAYKDRGIGTQAERLAVRYVFYELDIPTLYADSILPNTRSQHILEKIGFLKIGEDETFRYYRIDRPEG